jgi:phospholipase/lecithinase/hemolysin
VPVDVSLIAGGLAQGYNAGLADLVKGVRHWPGVRAAKTLDVYQKFNDMLDHPERYGFTNTTETCVTPNVVPYDCREPDEYVFWDGIHPTRAVHAVFGEAAAKMVGGKKAKEGRH